jgi:hypothetical protein
VYLSDVPVLTPHHFLAASSISRILGPLVLHTQLLQAFTRSLVMSGSHNAERPSRSPRRASYNVTLPDMYVTAQPCSIEIGHSLVSRSINQTTMPSPERNQYSNKEAAKVNAGIGFGGAETAETAETVQQGPFSTNVPAVDIDFSKLVILIVARESRTSTEKLVSSMLQPPRHAFVYGTLSMQWVMGAVGHQSFDFREADERYVLVADSDLRKRGAELGLPAIYVEWLCGDDSDTTASDLGVYLTPEFFKQTAHENKQ